MDIRLVGGNIPTTGWAVVTNALAATGGVVKYLPNTSSLAALYNSEKSVPSNQHLTSAAFLKRKLIQSRFRTKKGIVEKLRLLISFIIKTLV